MAIKNEIDKGHVYYFEPNDTSIGKDQDGADCIDASFGGFMYCNDINRRHLPKR